MTIIPNHWLGIIIKHFINGFAPKIDGLVKSPSAALRFNFVVAAPESFAPQGPHSSVFARLASGAFYETIIPPAFYEIIKMAVSKDLAV